MPRCGVAHRLELRLSTDKNQDTLGLHEAGANSPPVRSVWLVLSPSAVLYPDSATPPCLTGEAKSRWENLMSPVWVPRQGVLTDSSSRLSVGRAGAGRGEGVGGEGSSPKGLLLCSQVESMNRCLVAKE